MNFLTQMIEIFASMLLKADNWERIKHIVERAEDTNLSGEEKLAFALKEAKVIGLTLATQLLHIGISLAVTALFPNIEETK